MVPDVPLLYFAELSNLDGGFAVSPQISKALERIYQTVGYIGENTTGLDAEQKTTVANNIAEGLEGNVLSQDGIRAINIPLGNIYCFEGEQLEIELNLKANPTLVYTGSLELSTTIHDVKPANLLKYVERHDLDTNLSKVERLFIVSKEAFKTNDADPDYNMETNVYVEQDDGTSSEATLLQYMGYTQLMGRFEGNTPLHIANIFQNMDAIPDNLYVRTTGENLTGLRYLVVEKHLDLAKVDYSTRRNLKKKIQKVERIERGSAETAKALRHGEQMPKSGDLKIVENVISKD
ncbi:MAG: hypothetical protein ACQEQ0_08690 [Bacteroidota bacterium]